jgi:hypothetical protein
MQIAAIVRTLGLCSVVGLAGFAVGCGSDSGQGSGAKGAGAAILEEQKEARKAQMKARIADRKKPPPAEQVSRDAPAPQR